MYELFEKIMLIYSLILIICVMIFSFALPKDKVAMSGTVEDINHEEKEDRWKKVLRNIILFLTVGICIGGIIWFIRHREFIWVLFPIGLLTFFERMSEAIDSMEILQKTLNSKGNTLLSIKEQVSVLAVAIFVGMLNAYNAPIKCMRIVEDFQNEIVSDILLLGILIVFVTVYYFLIGAMLLISIKSLIRTRKLMMKGEVIQKVTKSIEKYRKWNQQLDDHEYISVKMMEWGGKGKRKWLVMPLLIFTIIIDVFVKLVIAILRIVLSIGEHIINGTVRVAKMTSQVIRGLTGMSDRKVMIFIFRSSLIFSLTSIVIVNRYMPVLKKYEEGTATLEFIASAIVIPLVLSWIMEYKKQE